MLYRYIVATEAEHGCCRRGLFIGYVYCINNDFLFSAEQTAPFLSLHIINAVAVSGKPDLYQMERSTVFSVFILQGAEFFMKSFRKFYADKPGVISRFSIKGRFEDMDEPHQQKHKASALTPAPGISDELNYDICGIISGCFTKDTIVSTSEGPFYLGDLCDINKNPGVITQDRSILKTGGVSAGGIQDIFGLLTDCSYIKGGAKNLVLRISEDCKSEMTGLTDLRKGDLVVCQNGLFGSQVPKYNSEVLDVFDAQELGKHISNMANVQNSDLYFADKFHNKSGYFSINIYNVLSKFDAFVFRVPEKILGASKEYVAAYLRGYFDGGTRFHLNRVSAPVSCRELASDLVYLLNLFEISGKIIKTLSGFEVVISGKDDINIFREEIGFLNDIHDFSGARAEPVNSVIDYAKLCKEYNARALETLKDFLTLPEILAELLKQPDKYKENFISLGLEQQFNTLKLLSYTGCRVTEVKEYAKYTGRDEVFGVINMAGNHTWCANGIIVSDSTAGQI
ncbi:hypothetical protein EZX71_25145 [Salmonella enterica subsp. enterica serovar Java]|uniref:DOD-type homing endonuclease domain-containing protein n=1 Tax=Salmonella enterica subsp. enterica serovar Java TaxID=224729 RepID=A0A6H2Y4I1_SALEB|nr:hypothetical protein [Salmonella enterica subsp. enterica serovar Java]